MSAGGRGQAGAEGPTRAGGPASDAAGGAPSGAGAAGGAGVGTAGAPGPNCLYPYRAVEPLSGDTDVADYVVSSPFTLDAASQNWGALSGAYDINGDWVSDVLYRDASSATYRLLESVAPPDILDMEEVECEALSALPVGRLLLRDLDADGVLDFVVGLEQRFVAYLNHPAGIEKVLDYAPPGATERLQLITLEAIDLDGDERLDLVIGFDRLASGAALDFDAGVVSFLQGADKQFRPSRAIAQSFGDLAADELGTLSGYLAAGHFTATGEPVVLVFGAERGTGHAFAAAPSWIGDLGPTYLLRDELPPTVVQGFALPRSGQPDLLAVVGEDEFSVMDWSGAVPATLFSVPLTYSGGLTHELGGGPEMPRYYFYDLDLDGDKDFLERSPGRSELTLHVNLANGAFASPQAFSIGTAALAEAPFLNVGPARAVLDEAQLGDADSTPSIYTLVSVKTGVK